MAISGATDALNRLKSHNIPFVLCTNGGGLPESTRVSHLSKILGIHIAEKQFMQSHTPWLAHTKPEHPAHKTYKNVLVSGGIGDACRGVALGYGFKHATIPFDILAQNAAVWPYHTLSESERQCAIPLSREPIDAVYVYHDPRDWGLDSQIILDILVSQEGVIGSRQSSRAIESGTSKQAVPLYFSNPDLLWANAYDHPRLGQGAFKILLESLYYNLTKRKLVSEQIGKPSRVTYEYARQVLADYQAQLSHGSAQQEAHVYMVGDNKASDIKGANDFGWSSILVKTGVFQGTKEEGESGNIAATFCVEDVGTAVDLVLRRHGIA